MWFMDKRAQFYLIAAFLIIIVFAGLRYVYTSVRTPIDIEHFYDLADEIYFEGNQLINNRVLEGKTDSEIASEFVNIISYYNNRNPNAELKLVYGDEDKVYVVDKNSPPIEIVPVGGKVSVSIGGENKEQEIKPGQKNFIVLLNIEREEGKILVIK